MSERPRLYWRRVASDQLADAMKAFEADFDYLYLESEATIELTSYRTPDSTWIRGRAFGAKLEVRWKRVEDEFDLLLLTEGDTQPVDGWRTLEDENLQSDAADPPTQVLLWGTHISQLAYPHHLAGEEGDAWIETRIPRPLKYPVEGAPRQVKANVIVYRNQGRPVLTRLVSLEGEKDEPRPLW